MQAATALRAIAGVLVILLAVLAVAGRTSEAGMGATLMWGDIDCSGDIGTVDALKGLRHVAGLSVAQEPGCPAVASAVSGGFFWGDWNCSGNADTVDALAVIRHTAGLAGASPESCPAIGDPLMGSLSITLDESLVPGVPEATPFEDGIPRPLAAVAESSGAQMDFVVDEVLVVEGDPQVLAAFLARRGGQIVSTVATSSNGPLYLARVSPSPVEAEVLEERIRRLNPGIHGDYRVSSAVAAGLLAVVAEELAEGLSIQPHWSKLDDTIDYGLAFGVSDYLKPDCSFALRREIQMLQQLVQGNISPEQAIQHLEQTVGDPSDCRPPVPEHLLVDGLVLPEIQPRAELAVIMNVPAAIPDGLTAEIVAATGPFTENSLYGGGVIMSFQDRRIALFTQPTFSLNRCARTEVFTIRIHHSGGSADFEVTLPIEFRVYPVDVTVPPGQEADISLCASGDRGPRTWTWVYESGDPFPPPGLALVPDGDGDAAIRGTPETNAYLSAGRILVQQGASVREATASIRVAVDFIEPVSDACGERHVIHIRGIHYGQFFSCELPRPAGISGYAWEMVSGPDFLVMFSTAEGLRWHVGADSDPVAALGLHSAELRLTAPGAGVIAERTIVFEVGIPFTVWTQNTILRPNNPFVENTGVDNEERADLILDRVSGYDIVALQELFDDDQRLQTGLGALALDYDALWGPTQPPDCLFVFGTDILPHVCKEDSGLALLVRGGLTSASSDHFLRRFNLSASHHSEVFTQCADDDCMSQKGFSVSRVPFGTHVDNPGFGSHYVYIVNTHTQADYAFPGQYTAVRSAQLQQIAAYLDSPAFRSHPVIIVGDFNIVGGSQDYDAMMSGVFNEMEDIFAGFSADNASPLTGDSQRNAYAFYWNTLDGRTERLDYIFVRQGTDYELRVESSGMTDAQVLTSMCQNEGWLANPAAPGVRCYLSDHYGLEASFRLVAAGAAAPAAGSLTALERPSLEVCSAAPVSGWRGIPYAFQEPLRPRHYMARYRHP